MAAIAGHRLTLDPMGKCSNAFFSETTNMIKAKLYMNVHWTVLYNGPMLIYVLLWRPSLISDRHKKHKIVEDLPMIIPGQFGINCPSGFREEAFSQKLQILLKPNCT
jgi:hypothetical protein